MKRILLWIGIIVTTLIAILIPIQLKDNTANASENNTGIYILPQGQYNATFNGTWIETGLVSTVSMTYVVIPDTYTGALVQGSIISKVGDASQFVLQQDIVIAYDKAKGQPNIINLLCSNGVLLNFNVNLYVSYDILSLINKVDTAYQTGYLEGYSVGSNESYNMGYDSGYSTGVLDGKGIGYNNGYNEGYLIGLNEGLDDIGITGFIPNILGSYVNFLFILGDFKVLGISILDVILIFATLAIGKLLLKMLL